MGGLFVSFFYFRNVVSQGAFGLDFFVSRLFYAVEYFLAQFEVGGAFFGYPFAGFGESFGIRLFGDVEGVSQGGELRRYAVEKSAYGALFMLELFYFLPYPQNFVGVFCALAAKDVRVAAHEFFGEFLRDVVKIELPLLGGYFAV